MNKSEIAERAADQLDALHEWEEHTGKAATCSEGNAFLDGYRTGRGRAIADNVALRKLRNEILGILGLAREQLRAVVGNTNMSVLQLRLDEAYLVLGESGAAQGVSPPKLSAESNMRSMAKLVENLREDLGTEARARIKAEGDTRELKAALRKLIQNSSRHDHDDARIVDAADLIEVERLLSL